MGYDGKYGTVTTQYGDIPASEPVIVFRGRDRLVPELLSYYAALCRTNGSPDRHVKLVEATQRRFQAVNQTRTPDSERSREWMGRKLNVMEHDEESSDG